MKPVKYLIILTFAILFTLLLNAQSENNKTELAQITKTYLQCFEDSISEVAQRQPAVCSLLPEIGPINGNCARWYYSGDIQGCLPFTWGCVEGNANNFVTYEACMNSCGSNSCPLYIDLSNESINTANIQAKQQIIHSGVLVSNQQVQFLAGDRISLKNGFRTGNSSFKAKIDNNCELVITDCANYSGCLEYTGTTGQANHDLFGEFVMPYNNCLLNNIPEAVNNIPTFYSPVLDSVGSFDCGIPFYANIYLEDIQVMAGIDSIETSISLKFNSFYDDINNKILATEWIVNGESIKCNDNSVDFYSKTDNSFFNDVSCLIYSTDFENVYILDFYFSFAIGLDYLYVGRYAPVFSNSNTIDTHSLCVCRTGSHFDCPDFIGTIAIIYPNSD